MPVFSEQCTFHVHSSADPTNGQPLSTGCPLIVSPVTEVSLSHCKRMTCTGGGNILNYLQGTCEIRRCQGNDYMLSSTRGGWHIYVLDVARPSAVTATTLPSKATSVLPPAEKATVVPGNPTSVHVIAECCQVTQPRGNMASVGYLLQFRSSVYVSSRSL